MSTTSQTRPDALVAAYDDPAAPTEVTVYSAGGSVTEWITVDVEHAIELSDAR